MHFYYGKNYKYDIWYEGLNHNFFLHFLMANKKKVRGKYKSLEDLRKFKDAIQWGAATLNVQVPTQFFIMWDKFKRAYKNEHAAAKKKGLVDEHAADPIPYQLYSLILEYAIEENNIFVWFWTLSQWTFMARSNNIDDLSLHNFKNANDSIIGKYDKAKMQSDGEKPSEKNIYANPLKGRYQECFWTGLGIWCSWNNKRIIAGNSRLFFMIKR